METIKNHILNLNYKINMLQMGYKLIYFLLGLFANNLYQLDLFLENLFLIIFDFLLMPIMQMQSKEAEHN